MCKRYFFILFVLKICTFRFANYTGDMLELVGTKLEVNAAAEH